MPLADVSLAFGAAGRDHLAMAVISNERDFRVWLSDKPTSWTHVLACRAALRMLPFTLQARSLRNGVDPALLAFRALSMSWAARDAPAEDMRVTDDDAAIWTSIRDDATWLEDHSAPDRAAEALVAEVLWLETAPEWFAANWSDVSIDLRAKDAGYELWIRWFERRIDGHATAFDLPAAADREVQIRITQQEEPFWNRDPAVINAEIQSWIDHATPQAPNVPPQHPHELQTIARDGRVARLETPPLPAGADQDAHRRAAWDGIRAALADYRAYGSSNAPRLDRLIERIAAAVGEDFDRLNPVGLGIQAGYLQAYAERADDFLAAERAADLVALNMAVGGFLPQFTEWRAYLADAEVRPEVTPEAVAAATEIVTAIAGGDVAEPAVTTALLEMQADAQDEANARDSEVPSSTAYRQRLLVGLGNVLATAGKIAVGVTEAQMGAFKRGTDMGLEKASEGSVIALLTANWIMTTQLPFAKSAPTRTAQIMAAAADADIGLSASLQKRLVSWIGDLTDVIGARTRDNWPNDRIAIAVPSAAEKRKGTGFGELLDIDEGRRRLAEYAIDVPLEDWAGPLAGSSSLTHDMGIARSTLRDWQRRGEVIALPKGTRKHVFPLAQFVDGRPAEGIRDVLLTVGSPRRAWFWMVKPSPLLGNQLPIDLLRQERNREVLDAARAVFDRP